MRSAIRFDRLQRRWTRLRERAAAELACRTARVTAIDHDLAAIRDAEDVAGIRVPATGATGATVVLAWTYADSLARRAMGLLDDRVRAVTSAEGARETTRERRREEEQLARLAARAWGRIEERAERQRERALDELALWAHGRKR
jgi:hypothetical protein